MLPRQNVVFGVPRSGTTFLMHALEAVPDAACITGVIYGMGALHLAGQPLPAGVRRVLLDEFAYCFRSYLDSGLYRSRSRRLQKWKNTGCRLRDLPGLWRVSEDPETLIYKEPFLALAPAFVYEALPEARFVYLLRDGRDCAASLVKSYDVLTDAKLRTTLSTEARIGRPYDDRMVPWWVEEGDEDAFMSAAPYVRAIWMWRFMVLRCHAFFQDPEVRTSGRVLVVRYEEFMRDPVVEGERIAEHFGIALSALARRRLRAAHPHSIGNYTRWDPAEVAAAERVAGGALSLLGYCKPGDSVFVAPALSQAVPSDTSEQAGR